MRLRLHKLLYFYLWEWFLGFLGTLALLSLTHATLLSLFLLFSLESLFVLYLNSKRSSLFPYLFFLFYIFSPFVLFHSSLWPLVFFSCGMRFVLLLFIHRVRTFCSHFELLSENYKKLSLELEEKKNELSLLVLKATDQNRLELLGEISAMVLHDMRGPLQTIQFCLDQYQLEILQDSKEKYLLQLKNNFVRLLDLVESLQMHLRNPKNGTADLGVPFLTAHQAAIRLLEIQFKEEFFQKIYFQVNDELFNLNLKLLQTDLIHILYNLYKNSIQNFIQKKIPHPKIGVCVDFLDQSLVRIHISDNGGGFSCREFENLTSYRLTLSPDNIHQGLGMRLTRRLVERYHGRLSVLDQQSPSQGALFELEIGMVS